jgi:mono/diheme cytochrome c family protein
MQWYGLGIMVVWWTCLGMALAVEQSQLSPAEMVHVGHRYFVRYCSACHGAEGRGDGPAASALQSLPADLTRIAQRSEWGAGAWPSGYADLGRTFWGDRGA